VKFSARRLSLLHPSILSSARSCPLCAMLVDQIQLQLSPASVPDFLARPVTVRLWTEYQPGRCEPGPENLRIADINIFAIQEQGSDGVFGDYRLRVCAEEDSYASRWIIARPVHPKRSAQTLEQIKRWLHRCDGGHERCTVGLSGETVEAGDDAVQLPSRLVDVGVGIPPRTAPIRLCQTGGRRGRYTALSHRWGAKHPLTTITANLEEHQRRIPLEKLPQTFQDAIELTRRLGIRYIWIDSLCIVQDDASDWADESKQMGTIYERSYLTIAATSAPDGDGGLFRGGNGRHDQHGGYLKFPCSPAPNEKITDAKLRDYVEASYCIRRRRKEIPNGEASLLETGPDVLVRVTKQEKHAGPGRVYDQTRDCTYENNLIQHITESQNPKCWRVQLSRKIPASLGAWSQHIESFSRQQRPPRPRELSRGIQERASSNINA